jgi:hypothetical protein
VLNELSTTPWRRVGEWMYRSTIFLTPALAGGEWSASNPGRFTPGEKTPDTHWIGGWVDPRVGLDDLEKRKFWPYRESNSDRSVVQPVASRYTDCGIPAPVRREVLCNIIACTAVAMQ